MTGKNEEIREALDRLESAVMAATILAHSGRRFHVHDEAYALAEIRSALSRVEAATVLLRSGPVR